MPNRTHLNNNPHSDNSILTSTPSEQQINSLSYYCHHFKDYYEHFLMTCFRIAPSACLSPLVVVQEQDQFEAIMKEVEEQGYLLIDTFSDFGLSYKGWISWVFVGFNNRAYLVDAIALRQQVSQITSLLENRNIVKFTYRQSVLLSDVKREWNAFGVNFFDFELFQKSIGVNKALSLDALQLSQRPLQESILEELQERYNNMVKYLAQMRYFLKKESSQYSLYGYSNHFEQLLKEYHHRVYSFQEQEKDYLFQQAQRRREEKENNDSNAADISLEKKDFSLQTEREKNLCRLLIGWRQHMARILDSPPRDILTFQQIVQIVSEKPTSVLEVQQIMAKEKLETFELASKILEILAYEAEINDNNLNELQVRAVRKREDKNIKLLLAQLKWQDREEWLNRRNDQSIKLYKEIVSIVELDGSVIEEFTTEGMNNGPVTKAEIGRFVKYAEYLRNGNHRRLKEYYDTCPPLENEQDRSDDIEGWDSEDEYQFIVPKSVSHSLTSIADTMERTEKPQKMQNITACSLKGGSSSLSLNEDDGILGLRIEPLPQNIEQIYLRAVSVKKGYQKVQKKKGGRKQGRDQDQQFVPSWDHIQELLDI